MTLRETQFWRAVIRIFAVIAAILGLVVITNEILENIMSCNAGECTRIHVATMTWGLTLLALGLLVLQKGDVSMSLRDLTATGNAVATWFGRRAYDRKSVAIAAATTEELPVPTAPDPAAADHPSTAPATDLPTVREE